MKKTVFAMAALLLCLVVMIPMAFADEGTVRNITWTFEKDTLTISGEGTIEGDGPWNTYAAKVKHLVLCGDRLQVKCYFSGYKNVKTITLGKGVLATDDNIFQGMGKNGLKLVLESNVYQWNTGSFPLGKITSVELGEEVTNYVVEDQFLFNQAKDTLLLYFGDGKKKVVVPDTVKKIGDYAFSGSKIKGIILPIGLEEIGTGAFGSCNQLTEITIPESVKVMWSEVFSWCQKLSALHWCNLSINANYRLTPDHFVDINALKELVVPNYGDVSEISITFNNKLETIIISEGNVKLNGYNGSIGYDCPKLKAIYLPASLENIAVKSIPYSDNAKLYVLEGTAAHRFAQENGYPYVLVNPITKVTLSEEALTMKVGKSTKLKATIEPADATAQKVEWMSTDERVATVSNGTVKAVGEGQCRIICRGLDCGGITAECVVTVEPKK